MKRKKISAIIFAALFMAVGVYADDDDFDFYRPMSQKNYDSEVKRAEARAREGKHFLPVSDNAYAQECGSCHFAYPAQALPKRSWEKLMQTLPKHFGEDASLEQKTHSEILSYLQANAADVNGSKKSAKFLKTILKNQTPIRITETGYYKNKHDEVPNDVFKREQILSPANCNACHKGAEKGDFSDETIVVPPASFSK